MPNSILKQHAIENIWCEPSQDYQHVYKPQRLTPAAGAFKVYDVVQDQIRLPNYTEVNDRTRFHVYQIGFQWKTSYNINVDLGTWVRSDVLMTNNKLVIDTYFENGCMISNQDVYIQFTDSSNLIIAIAINNSFDVGREDVEGPILGEVINRKISLDFHDPIIRFYSAAYYRTDEWRFITNHPFYPVQQYSAKVTDLTSYNAFMLEYNNISDSFGDEGLALFYVDGYLENKPVGYNTRYIGKVLTVVWESAIKQIVQIAGSSLPSYVSELDVNVKKYIVMNPSDYGIIDYHDDVDVYIVKPTGNSYRGVVLTRFKVSTVRQLTHNTYAIDAQVVREVIAAHSFLGKLTDCNIMLVVRHGGLRHGLGHQAVRIEDMYKLPRSLRLEAMSGVNSLMTEWKAVTLEKSNYIKIMGLNFNDISETDIEKAYGYNAACKVAEPNYFPLEVVGAQKQLTLPPALNVPDTNDATHRSLFFYDNNGLYKGYWQNSAGTTRVVVPPEFNTAVAAEVIHSEVSETTDGCYYANVVANPDLEFWGHRCYTCATVDGVPNEQWTDVTGSNLYTYTVIAGVPTVTWNTQKLTQFSLYPCVKTGRYTHIHKAPALAGIWGGYYLTTVNSTVTFQGVTESRPQKLSPGNIEVTVNGMTLIEDLDYYVDFPRIVIVRRMTPTIDYTTANVEVRTRGWCDPVTERHYKSRDVGWVKDGLLSSNDVYNPRNDRNYKVVVDGCVYSAEDVTFAESAVNVDEGITARSAQILEGRAYAVLDTYTVVEPWSTTTTVAYITESRAIDTRVSEYLTPRLNELDPVNPLIIDQRWGLYSPIISAMLKLMVDANWLNNGELDTEWDHTKVDEWIEPLRFLLAYEPCLKELDWEYVWVYPHPYTELVSVTQKQYRFLEYIIKNYLKSKIDLTPSVLILGS